MDQDLGPKKWEAVQTRRSLSPTPAVRRKRKAGLAAPRAGRGKVRDPFAIKPFPTRSGGGAPLSRRAAPPRRTPALSVAPGPRRRVPLPPRHGGPPGRAGRGGAGRGSGPKGDLRRWRAGTGSGRSGLGDRVLACRKRRPRGWLGCLSTL